MAEIPSDQSPTLVPPQSGSDSSQYWCYNCDKRVTVETLADLAEVVCFECKNGFVEAISATTGAGAEEEDDPALDTQFLQILRLIARHVRDEHVREEGPVPAPNLDPTDEDYLRIELNGWDDDEDEEEEEEEEEEDDEDEVEVEDLHSVGVVNEDEGDVREHLSEESRSDGEEDEEEEENEVIEPRDEDEDQSERIRRLGLRFVEFAAQAANRVNRSDDGEEENEVTEHAEEDEQEPIRRRRVFRLRDRDFTTQSDSRRNRILDWAEILMGLEDHSIQFRMHVGESDTYVGNPGDYVDAAQYETLLQNLADSDSGGRRGAPPASKAAVEALASVVIGKEEDIMGCAICKDYVNVGEVAKNMPCGHGYHGECIVPWLDSRNSCPVCRFELPTDDPEYEEDRKKRGAVAGVRVESTSSSAAAAGGDHDGAGLD